MSLPVVPRRSSTLILAVRSKLANQAASSAGYQLLMLQRSSASKFMPNLFVFPGGRSEPTDFSSDWLELIGNQGLPLLESIRNSPFYTTYKSQQEGSLPAHIGFRICAIRETFEESGVLLVKSLPGNGKGSQQSEPGQHFLSSDELDTWRRRVNENASSFLQLCREMQCVPDIWSLYEWSNWITPAQFHKLRFNTIFYFAFLDKKPNMSHDGKEVTSSVWIEPEESLQLFFQNKFALAPPQMLEMARLCRFTDFNDLKEIVMSVNGVEEFEPIGIISKSGDQVTLFPADSMYEAMKSKTYRYYQEFVKTTKSKDLKILPIPLMKVRETTEELCVKDQITCRLISNLKTREFKVDCNLTTLKYNMPIFNDKFMKFSENAKL